MTELAEYVSRGWKIFPCHSIQSGRCTCPKGIDCKNPGKHPLTYGGFKDATLDMSVISAWQSRWPFANWSVATGRETGLVVIDIDPRHDGFTSIDQLEENRDDGPLPDTLRSQTGGGGRHLFYAYPPDTTIPTRNPWLKGVEVKSDGGYVLLPESEHISGARYKWIDFRSQPAPLPHDVATSILSRSVSAHSDLPSTTDILKGVPEGERDTTLFRAACRLRRQLHDRGAVEILILEAAANCEPPFSQEDALRKVEQAFRQDHTDSFVDWQAGRGQPEDSGDGPILPRTDLGNALRLVDAYGDNVRYVEGWGWLVWSEIGWRRDGMGTVSQLSHQLSSLVTAEARRLEGDGADIETVKAHMKFALRSESAAAMEAAVRVMKNREDVRKSVDDFDAEDFLLASRNVIIDLRDGGYRTIDRNDLVTKNTGVLYDPDFRMKEWDEFLLRVCDGDLEVISYLQRAVGYTLTGSNAEEVLFIVSGLPQSGKSTFLDAVHAAMGSYATSTQAETFMWNRSGQQPREELARMAGMRLVSMSEPKEGASFSENLIKTVTGGDPITGKYLYENPFTYRPKFKLWVGTNHDPGARDDALWRRLKKIEFPHTIPMAERKNDLKIKLRDPDHGGRAVLAWAVKGAIEWHQRGLDQPASITRAIDEYRLEQDHIAQFKTEVLQPSDRETEWLKSVYQAYQTWCHTTGQRATTRQTFEKMLKAREVKIALNDDGIPYVIGYTIKQDYKVWSQL